MNKNCKVLLQLIPLLLCLPTIMGAKILGLFAHPSESHFSVMQTVMLELVKRQHTVTIYSSHQLNESRENLTEIFVGPEYPFWQKLQAKAGVKSLQELSQLSEDKIQKDLGFVGAAATDYFLSHTALQKLHSATKADFDYDVIVVDLFYTDSLLAFAYAYNKPVVGIVSSNFENYMQHVLEYVMPVACSPIDFETYEKNIGYWQRLSNTRSCLSRKNLFSKNNISPQQELIKKHFTNLKDDMPTIIELYNKLDVLLLNNYPPLQTPRPMLPNIIAAGGLHIRPPRELPWHIKRFLDESRSGAIYMNLGNEQFCAEIPKEKLQTLFNVLGKFKGHIIWTCHDVEKIENMPKNMLIQHAVPQTDILAHPHVKVFIMNGDLLSLQEGIIRHVPMLGIPIFRNEFHNVELAERLEVGLKIINSNLTENSLTWGLENLQNNADYQITIRKVSTTFRNRPLGALETSMFWIDYVLRYNGADVIKTKGIGISTRHLHLMDLCIYYAIITLFIVTILIGLYFLVFYILKRNKLEKMYSKLS
ncbi:UDP-glycosyltransferase UGT4-like [Teleopsis dalmanni]|uniref:UDP-glycosyltransferase UGT4-like n=1 Tax=Teleopsis dalmanni TaxID=139649 RepID=UPI0018CE7788|nr:UDP-glycosyltransferase UGT4-like [Teleopsis dalmanni]